MIYDLGFMIDDCPVTNRRAGKSKIINHQS